MLTKTDWTALLVIAAVSVLVYLPSFHAPFFFDDTAQIVHNSDIREIKNITGRLWNSEAYRSKLYPYRPLVYISFALDYARSGLNPAAYRAVNIIVHILVCLLIFVLTRKIWDYAFGVDSAVYPLIAALLFCLHPIQTEAVTYIVHREDSMCMLFYLFGVLGFCLGKEKHRIFYLASLMSFVLAALCKEMAVMMPFTIVLFDYFFMSGRDWSKVRTRVKVHTAYFIAMAVYVFFRWWQVRGLGRVEFLTATWTSLSYVAVQPWVIVNYLRLLVLPIGQSIDHFILPARNAQDVLKYGAGWLGLGAIIWPAWKYRRKNSGIYLVILFGAGWFILNLVPTSSILPINDAMVERRLYVPGWGFVLAATSGLYGLNLNRAKLYGVCAIVLLALGGLTFKRNRLYNNPIGLWQEVIALYPSNFRAHNNLANLYADRKEFSSAIDEYLMAIKIHPLYASAHSNLAIVYCETKDYDRALEFAAKAAELNPRRADPYNVTGRVYAEQGRFKESELSFLKGIELDSRNVSAHAGLGLLYYQNKKFEQAAQVYEHLLSVEPLHLEAINNLGLVYYALKNYPKALEWFERAGQIAPRTAGTFVNMGNIYFDLKKFDSALVNYERAGQLDPGNAVLKFNQGLVYMEQKKTDEALGCFQKAIELNPSYVEAHFQTGEIYLARKDNARALQYFEKVLRWVPSDLHVKQQVEYLRGRGMNGKN